MGVSIITPPSGYALSLADAKLWDRIGSTDEDGPVAGLIRAAQDYFQKTANVVLLTTTFLQGWHSLPRSIGSLKNRMDLVPIGNEELLLQKSPAATITQIQYYDSNNTLQTWASSNWQYDLTGQHGRICPTSGNVWPECYPQTYNALQVTYTAGYGSDQTHMPENVQHWLREAVAFAYWHREGATLDEVFSNVPFGMESLFWSERVFDLV